MHFRLLVLDSGCDANTAFLSVYYIPSMMKYIKVELGIDFETRYQLDMVPCV